MISGRAHDRQITRPGELQAVPPGRQPDHDLQRFGQAVADQAGLPFGARIERGTDLAVAAEEEGPAGVIARDALQCHARREADRLTGIAAREIELAETPEHLGKIGVPSDQVQDFFMASHPADDSGAPSGEPVGVTSP